MDYKSVPTRGRTLDYAAGVYDVLEPWVMFGKQNHINQQVVDFLDIKQWHRILDIGCGTGVVTKLISGKLSSKKQGMAIGIDAAGKMIEGAVKKRESDTCSFKVAAAEKLPFENESFDSAVSTLFFHHIQLDLKKKAFAEAFRILKPGGRLVVSDMHIPETILGFLIAHASRWLLFQPQIGENIRGVLPEVIENAGFVKPRLIKTYLGYITLFLSEKPMDRMMDNKS
ncbi:MAG: methyltransferase domain-containing protein [Desulfobacula sp.]|nr:methyltransferase domain-containing protein [Desulfobacula sp.]